MDSLRYKCQTILIGIKKYVLINSFDLKRESCTLTQNANTVATMSNRSIQTNEHNQQTDQKVH